MSKIRNSTRGGYRFKNFKGKPAAKVENSTVPGKVTIPLRQGFGTEVEPVVTVGEHVSSGQIIGRNDETISSPVHASVAGNVTDIREILVAGDKQQAIIIETDAGFRFSNESTSLLAGHSSDWKTLDSERLGELIYLSGVSALASGGIPTQYRSSPIEPMEVESILVLGLEDEPLSPSLNAILPASRYSDFLDGIRMLKRVLPEASAHIAIDTAHKDLINSLSQHIGDEDEIELRAVKGKFPYSWEEVAVPMVFGKRVPSGHQAVNIGIVVVSVQTVLHVFDAIANGIPMIERTIAMAGEGFAEPQHVRVPVGVSIGELTKERLVGRERYRIVRDSLLTGHAVGEDEEPIVRVSRALYAIPELTFTGKFSFMGPGTDSDSYSKTFIPIGKKKIDTNLHGEERACLSCSFCAEVCPAGIQPNILHRYVINELFSETLLQFKIFDCIECNLCSYVCPSKIPVANLMREGKKRMTDEGFSSHEVTESHQKLKGVQ
ncbi:MAG: 4Fe-4S dicluster domain-containing protein [Alkalispirochaeta sp.]